MLRDPEHFYTHEQVCDLLEMALSLGFSLDVGSGLEGLTVLEVQILVDEVFELRAGLQKRYEQ